MQIYYKGYLWGGIEALWSENLFSMSAKKEINQRVFTFRIPAWGQCSDKHITENSGLGDIKDSLELYMSRSEDPCIYKMSARWTGMMSEQVRWYTWEFM